MATYDNQVIIRAYQNFIGNKNFPCTGAKAAQSTGNIFTIVGMHLECPSDDYKILEFLYSFVEHYRQHLDTLCSAAVLFHLPVILHETEFDRLIWVRLQALSDLDAEKFPYDPRVSADPTENNFSFSLMQESFYIIGLHPASSRKARQFGFPALVFNPHQQFERLKETSSYEKMKHSIRKRDTVFSGSVNPMLDEFGKTSEARQYSGQHYGENWNCPFKRTI